MVDIMSVAVLCKNLPFVNVWRILGATVLTCGFTWGAAHAAVVNIDLSAATTGTQVNGIGANFAQTFAGQAVSGPNVTGAPTTPLALQAAGQIDVVFFSPGVSPASNSLLSQPGNVAPLSIHLNAAADAFTWTMGSANAGSTILASAFDATGGLVHSQSITMASGYSVYTISGIGTFRGITFSGNNDSGGVRFQNMSYNDVPQTADLAITKTDGVTSVSAGGSLTYTITASNAGPSNAPGATVADTLPASLTGTWTCVGAGGGTCTAAGSGNINDTVNLPAGGSVTYTVTASVASSATGTLSNTATVSPPGAVTDPNPANNSATDTDTVTAAAAVAPVAVPGLSVWGLILLSLGLIALGSKNWRQREG